MRVDIAAVADYASVTQEGKLVIGGAFDRIVAMQLPWRHPTMSLVLRVGLEPDDPREFTIAAHCMDADGHPVVPPMEQRVQLPLDAGSYGPSANLLFTMNGVQFAEAGRYAFEVFADGAHVATVPFEVVVTPGGASAPGSVTMQ